LASVAAEAFVKYLPVLHGQHVVELLSENHPAEHCQHTMTSATRLSFGVVWKIQIARSKTKNHYLCISSYFCLLFQNKSAIPDGLPLHELKPQMALEGPSYIKVIRYQLTSGHDNVPAKGAYFPPRQARQAD
jgi:hypothetical protein